MIYCDSSALLKFVKPEKESQALRTWRLALEPGLELLTSRLAALELSRTLLRAGVDRERVPYVVGQALRGSTCWTSRARCWRALRRTVSAASDRSTRSISPLRTLSFRS